VTSTGANPPTRAGSAGRIRTYNTNRKVLPVDGTPTPDRLVRVRRKRRRVVVRGRGTAARDETVTELDASRTRIRNVLDERRGHHPAADTDGVRHPEFMSRGRPGPSGFRNNRRRRQRFPRPTPPPGHDRRQPEEGGVGKDDQPSVNPRPSRLSMHGLRVLVIDPRPRRANASHRSSASSTRAATPSIYEVLVDGMPPGRGRGCRSSRRPTSGAYRPPSTSPARRSSSSRSSPASNRLAPGPSPAYQRRGSTTSSSSTGPPVHSGLLNGQRCYVAGDEVLIPIQCEY